MAGMSIAEAQELGEKAVESVKRYVARAIATVTPRVTTCEERLSSLEQRIAELERPAARAKRKS